MAITKKSIKVEYYEVIDFLKIYTKPELEDERNTLEEMCRMSLARIALTEDYFDFIDEFSNFANEVGYEYCSTHQIFYEYEKCPLCVLSKFEK